METQDSTAWRIFLPCKFFLPNPPPRALQGASRTWLLAALVVFHDSAHGTTAHGSIASSVSMSTADSTTMGASTE